MSFLMVSFGDIVTAAEMALRIVQVLYESSGAPEDYQNAMAELVSLHHELILINDAVQLDATSGLGEIVRQSVTMEVARCYADMQQFLDKTKAVGAKGIVGALSKVWWAASEAKELRALRAAVARHRAALGILIGSSNLIISTTTRNEVFACRNTIQELTTTLKPVPHHVAEDMVFIVDPLGDVIRISLTYSLKYSDLYRIIQAYYPRDRAGSRHISEGSYHLLYSTDGSLSRPLQVDTDLQPGATLEMSMLLRERASFLEQRKTCPRCRQNKSEVAAQAGWRKCMRCSKFFQVIPDDSELKSCRRPGDCFPIVPKVGPKQDDDGIEHFRRIELTCVEDILQLKAKVIQRISGRLPGAVDVEFLSQWLKGHLELPKTRFDQIIQYRRQFHLAPPLGLQVDPDIYEFHLSTESRSSLQYTDLPTLRMVHLPVPYLTVRPWPTKAKSTNKAF
ncbi:hypothetical protein B0H16DRAFT_1590133 [Mycena metata]|uniref:Ubiquitin-like domain-containing protein n=1 Tax=Mycena metata TaxID=1033252 RepID=A0AAD7HT82_9AGAR|nr:hypothetical protein B0H16DRAFT_1590133 [Mycena metata]